MKFVTAGNARFRPIVDQWVQHVTALGLSYEVYDLGGLGYGTPFEEPNLDFQRDGVYRTQHTAWETRALFKPRVVSRELSTACDETICWLDADAWIVAPIDASGDYDIGVCKRKGGNPDKFGRYNAGVVFFQPTDAARIFVQVWSRVTKELGNDQVALNELLVPPARARVKEFPHGYNAATIGDDTRILHLRGTKLFAPLPRQVESAIIEGNQCPTEST